MLPHALIDLHCDTLTAPGQDCSLDDPCHQFALSKVPRGVRWCQCCAIFIPDELRGDDAVAYYDRHRDSFQRQMDALSDKVLTCRTAADIEAAWAAGKTAAVLTVENGSALAGRLDRVELLARDGVRMVTLTWNGENELGSGNQTDRGLTAFGRQAVRELERAGILVDASHLNDRGFAGLLDTAQRPFVASHSNARAVCPHRRNLTDGQIREMADRGCLIGLNFFQDFLRPGDRPAGLDDLWRHVEHFLELGAERCLALGSDADGADLPPGLDSPRGFAGLYQYFLDRGLSREQAEGILWKNALDFFQKHLNS